MSCDRGYQLIAENGLCRPCDYGYYWQDGCTPCLWYNETTIIQGSVGEQSCIVVMVQNYSFLTFLILYSIILGSIFLYMLKMHGWIVFNSCYDFFTNFLVRTICLIIITIPFGITEAIQKMFTVTNFVQGKDIHVPVYGAYGLGVIQLIVVTTWCFLDICAAPRHCQAAPHCEFNAGALSDFGIATLVFRSTPAIICFVINVIFLEMLSTDLYDILSRPPIPLEDIKPVNRQLNLHCLWFAYITFILIGDVIRLTVGVKDISRVEFLLLRARLNDEEPRRQAAENVRIQQLAMAAERAEEDMAR